MNNCSMQLQKERFSARAGLAAIGVKVHQMQILQPIEEQVTIKQKQVCYTAFEKLTDALITILAGARGLVEVNKRLRSDPGLQAAFGRQGCAEQSVVQATLDAATTENVTQMYAAMDAIYQQHSVGYQHNYEAEYQLLDLDMSGRVCGPKAALATKGYFTGHRNRHGRQLGRVLATHYNEVVVDRVFTGKEQLTGAFQPLMRAAERTLNLDATKRARTILRVDSGGGSPKDINWALEHGYHFHGKDYVATRARKLVNAVTEWVVDPRNPERQIGWVTEPTTAYVRDVRRVAVRCRKRNGQWATGVLISTLSDEDAIALTQQPCHLAQDPHAVLLALVYFYDQRGGGVETSFKEDHQGLGANKRNKKRFEAQQILTQLNALAHNIIIWARAWLAPHFPKLARFGVLRLVRDIFHTTGRLVFGDTGHLQHCTLNQADIFAQGLAAALAVLLAPEHVTVNLGEI